MAEKNSFPRYKFDGSGILALIGGYLVSSLILGSLSGAYAFITDKSSVDFDFFVVFGNAFVFSFIIFAFDYFVCRPSTGKKLNFNFSTANFYTYLLIFPMMFGMMLIADFFTSQIPITGPFWGQMYEWFSELMGMISKDLPTMIIMTVIMAPIFEEIIFRGIVQKGLINGGMKPLKAIWISAFFFGLVHGNPWQFVGAVLLGFVLGTVYQKTKSLLLPMLLHAFNNLISTLLITFTDTENFSLASKTPEWMILAAGIVLFSIFFYLFTRKNKVIYSE